MKKIQLISIFITIIILIGVIFTIEYTSANIQNEILKKVVSIKEPVLKHRNILDYSYVKTKYITLVIELRKIKLMNIDANILKYIQDAEYSLNKTNILLENNRIDEAADELKKAILYISMVNYHKRLSKETSIHNLITASLRDLENLEKKWVNIVNNTRTLEMKYCSFNNLWIFYNIENRLIATKNGLSQVKTLIPRFINSNTRLIELLSLINTSRAYLEEAIHIINFHYNDILRQHHVNIDMVYTTYYNNTLELINKLKINNTSWENLELNSTYRYLSDAKKAVSYGLYSYATIYSMIAYTQAKILPYLKNMPDPWLSTLKTSPKNLLNEKKKAIEVYKTLLNNIKINNEFIDILINNGLSLIKLGDKSVNLIIEHGGWRRDYNQNFNSYFAYLMYYEAYLYFKQLTDTLSFISLKNY